ncbi:hypothetical protein FQR65_LT18848 [Abscondita terminalis]|nr:hypothetical protein FQR65_LT18848 [Abscondita terminalis]
MIEGWGMSETCAIGTNNPVIASHFSGNIGLPLPGISIAIKDDDGRDLPMGEAGELCIKGPNVMRGYYNQPEETAKAFTTDGYMRTGDVGIMDAQGFTRIHRPSQEGHDGGQRLQRLSNELERTVPEKIEIAPLRKPKPQQQKENYENFLPTNLNTGKSDSRCEMNSTKMEVFVKDNKINGTQSVLHPTTFASITVSVDKIQSSRFEWTCTTITSNNTKCHTDVNPHLLQLICTLPAFTFGIPQKNKQPPPFCTFRYGEAYPKSPKPPDTVDASTTKKPTKLAKLRTNLNSEEAVAVKPITQPNFETHVSNYTVFTFGNLTKPQRLTLKHIDPTKPDRSRFELTDNIVGRHNQHLPLLLMSQATTELKKTQLFLRHLQIYSVPPESRFESVVNLPCLRLKLNLLKPEKISSELLPKTQTGHSVERPHKLQLPSTNFIFLRHTQTQSSKPQLRYRPNLFSFPRRRRHSSFLEMPNNGKLPNPCSKFNSTGTYENTPATLVWGHRRNATARIYDIGTENKAPIGSDCKTTDSAAAFGSDLKHPAHRQAFGRRDETVSYLLHRLERRLDVKTVSSFGARASEEPTKPVFSFGAAAAAKAPEPAKPVAFGFGNSAAQPSQPAAPSGGFSFNSNNNNANPAPSFNFSTPKIETASPFQSPASNIFNTPLSTQTQSLQNGGFNFGSTPSTNNNMKTGFNFGATNQFNATPAAPAPASSGVFSFGSNPNPQPQPATGGFNFVQNAAPPSAFNANMKPNFNFTAGNSPAAFSATSDNNSLSTVQRRRLKAVRRNPR